MKGIKMSEQIKCFNLFTLIEANKAAAKNKYNRQLDAKFVASLPDDKWFPIFFTMIHEHAGGVRVEPHMRCWVSFDEKGTKAFIDVPMKLYNSLATFNVPEEAKAE